MHLLSDFDADAPRRKAAQEWHEWVARVSKFIPSTYKNLPGEALGIATEQFTEESGLIRNSELFLLSAFVSQSAFLLIILSDCYESQLKKLKEGPRGKKRSNKSSGGGSRSESLVYFHDLTLTHI